MENINLLIPSKHNNITGNKHENKLVFSIGYEGINFDYFLELLNKNKSKIFEDNLEKTTLNIYTSPI